jgi:hypothetical protein
VTGELHLVEGDIFTIDPTQMRGVKVLKTSVGGRLIWEADEQQP